MKLREKIKLFCFGLLAVPALVGIIVTLTWVRKHTSEFWAWVFGI
jgi:hypothetical protein